MSAENFCPYCKREIKVEIKKADDDLNDQQLGIFLSNAKRNIESEELKIQKIQTVIDELQAGIVEANIRLKSARRNKEILICQYLELQNEAQFSPDIESRKITNLSNRDDFSTPTFLRKHTS